MPEVMHPLKAIRLKVVQIIRDAAITVALPNGPRAAEVLEHPPSSGLISETRLPGIYVYCRSETRSNESVVTDTQRVLVDVVLQSLGNDLEAIDHVDEMQLGVELALLADLRLGGLVLDIRPLGSEIDVERGEVNFAMRRVTFEALRSNDRQSPSVEF